MKRNKTPHINATIYDGDFQLIFECVGETSCRFALCSLMPPDGSDNCCFLEYGSCRCPAAQMAAIESLMTRMKKELKQLAEVQE